MRRVEVKWLDSMTLHYGEWADRSAHEAALDKEGMIHHSCGYLYAESEDAVLVANSVYKNDTVDNAAGVTLIPRSAILSVTELTDGD